MLLGLLSDTHDNVANMRAGLEMLRRHEPAAYLHAGDLISESMLDEFAGIDRPVHFVFGNNEYDLAGVRSRAISLGLNCHGEVADLTFGEKRLALLHGDDFGMLSRLIKSGSYAYVIHGHTHVRRDERVGATRVINPGALQRARVKSVALLDVAADTMRFLEVGPAAKL
jgi:putative phosphoesterase